MNADEVSGMLAKAFDEIRFQVREQLVQAQERLESAVLVERERCAKLVEQETDWRWNILDVAKETAKMIRSGE